MLDRYLAYLQSVRNLSRHTIRAYETDVVRYRSFLERHGVAEDDADGGVIRRFLAELQKEGMAPRSVNRAISGVRGYYRFKQQMCDASSTDQPPNPFEGFRGVKGTKRLPTFLFEEEMKDLSDATATGKADEFMCLRDSAIVETLYSTGCRISELVAMNLGDVDIGGRSARVGGKGGKDRVVFLGGASHAALVRYLVVRGERARHTERGSVQAVFINAQGRRLTDRGARYILNRNVERTAIRKKVSPHTLRHTMATHVLDAGADIRVVQELLGHASLSTTQIYTHVGLSRLQAVYRRAHPHAHDDKRSAE